MGRYLARSATSSADLDRIMSLRSQIFRPGSPPDADRDRFDDTCLHVMIEDDDGDMAGSFRLMVMPGERVGESYSAQFYDLSALARRREPVAELGRFCLAPGTSDHEVLRVALAAMARVVDDRGVGFLFGCSSFYGTDPAPYQKVFSLLRDRFLAPLEWRPAQRASKAHHFEEDESDFHSARGFTSMPPLLRSYLSIGGRVSDHAVIDEDLNTLHVFTGVDVAEIPEARKRRLRSMAAPD